MDNETSTKVNRFERGRSLISQRISVIEKEKYDFNLEPEPLEVILL